MNTVTLRRSGNSPIAFRGWKVAESVQPVGKYIRWHDITVYETAGGQYVIHVEFHTKWGDENSKSSVAIRPKRPISQVVDVLHKLGAIGRDIGYPNGAAFELKQTRLMAEIQRRYEEQVADVLSVMGVAEEVPAMPAAGSL